MKKSVVARRGAAGEATGVMRRLVTCQNLSDRAAGKLVPQIGQCAHSPNPGSLVPFEAPKSRSLRRCEVRVGPLLPRPSHFLAIVFRCHANKVSSVSILATSL